MSRSRSTTRSPIGGRPNGVQFDGDPKVFAMIAGLTDQPDTSFAIVTP